MSIILSQQNSTPIVSKLGFAIGGFLVGLGTCIEVTIPTFYTDILQMGLLMSDSSFEYIYVYIFIIGTKLGNGCTSGHGVW